MAKRYKESFATSTSHENITYFPRGFKRHELKSHEIFFGRNLKFIGHLKLQLTIVPRDGEDSARGRKKLRRGWGEIE